MAAQKKKKRRRAERIRRVLHISFLVILISLVAAYTAGCFLLRGKFLQNTYVNGVDYGNMTAEEAESFFRTTYEGKTLKIKERGDKTETISYDDIGYRLKTGETFQELIDNQNYLAWPLTYLEKTQIRTPETFEYSESKLDALLKKLEAVKGSDVVMPVSAYIEKTDAGFFLRDEILGTRILFKKLLPAVEAAINDSESVIDLEKEDVYMKPEVYSTDEGLQKQMAEIRKLEDTVISIYMEGGVTVELDKSTFVDWMRLEDGKLIVSDDKIVEYTNQLADQYDTYLHERPFKTSNGDTVMVGGGPYDNYGYLMNREESAIIIKNALLSGVSQTIALEWQKYGWARDENGGDFGSTYVEVSIDAQHLWFYKNGELIVETNVVTGTAIPSRATPTGCFHVLQMLQDHTMQGSYGQSYASYVIAIMMNGICIHDSSWRGTSEYDYGGDTFYYDGSHGCINTPYPKVKQIYENIDGGTPVVIYDRLNTCPNVHNETYTGGENNGGYTDDDEYYYDE